MSRFVAATIVAIGPGIRVQVDHSFAERFCGVLEVVEELADAFLAGRDRKIAEQQRGGGEVA